MTVVHGAVPRSESTSPTVAEVLVSRLTAEGQGPSRWTAVSAVVDEALDVPEETPALTDLLVAVEAAVAGGEPATVRALANVIAHGEVPSSPAPGRGEQVSPDVTSVVEGLLVVTAQSRVLQLYVEAGIRIVQDARDRAAGEVPTVARDALAAEALGRLEALSWVAESVIDELTGDEAQLGNRIDEAVIALADLYSDARTLFATLTPLGGEVGLSRLRRAERVVDLGRVDRLSSRLRAGQRVLETNS